MYRSTGRPLPFRACLFPLSLVKLDEPPLSIGVGCGVIGGVTCAT
jgi:hypothetical protein